MEKKDATYWRILNSAILLDLRWGHQKWSLALLARTAKVARSLIYYYFGRSKFDILVHAVKLIGFELSGQSDESHKRWEQGKMAESFLAGRKLIENTPALTTFYYLNRDKDNEIGDIIRQHEKALSKKIKQYFPHLSTHEVEGVRALVTGIVYSPGLSDACVASATGIIQRGLKKD